MTYLVIRVDAQWLSSSILAADLHVPEASQLDKQMRHLRPRVQSPEQEIVMRLKPYPTLSGEKCEGIPKPYYVPVYELATNELPPDIF